MLKNLQRIMVLLGMTIVLEACSEPTANSKPTEIANMNETGKPLIVISAPSVNDDYYAEVFDEIIEYDIEFAKRVMGKDNIIILADKETLPYLQDELPEEILLEANIYDIWMRDFSPVMYSRQVKFDYLPNYLKESDATDVDKSFKNWLADNGIKIDSKTNLILDGGNVVDNGKDKVVITERIFADNPDWTEAEIEQELKDILGVTEIAFLPEVEGDTTGHSDGMVMFTEQDVLLVNTYEGEFRNEVLDSLQNSLTDVEIIEVPTEYDLDIWKNFVSACGLNLNSLVTDNYIYTPVFGTATDDEVLSIIKENTGKEVVPINAENVCFMGGSVRCLSWQVKGEIADQLVELAKEK